MITRDRRNSKNSLKGLDMDVSLIRQLIFRTNPNSVEEYRRNQTPSLLSKLSVEEEQRKRQVQMMWDSKTEKLRRAFEPDREVTTSIIKFIPSHELGGKDD